MHLYFITFYILIRFKQTANTEKKMKLHLKRYPHLKKNFFKKNYITTKKKLNFYKNFLNPLPPSLIFNLKIIK